MLGLFALFEFFVGTIIDVVVLCLKLFFFLCRLLISAVRLVTTRRKAPDAQSTIGSNQGGRDG